jgi:hypothetical protein
MTGEDPCITGHYRLSENGGAHSRRILSVPVQGGTKVKPIHDGDSRRRGVLIDNSLRMDDPPYALHCLSVVGKEWCKSQNGSDSKSFCTRRWNTPGASCSVSLDRHDLSNSVCWQSAKGVFSSVFKNQLNGLSQTCQCLLLRPSLAIRTGNLRAIRYEPLTISLDNSCKFVLHKSLPPPYYNKSLLHQEWTVQRMSEAPYDSERRAASAHSERVVGYRTPLEHWQTSVEFWGTFQLSSPYRSGRSPESSVERRSPPVEITWQNDHRPR